MSFLESIQGYDGQPLTRQVLLDLLKGYHRPFDKLSELVKQQILIQVKRGLFVPGPKSRVPQPEPYLLANHLAGPSYVSFETALTHWRLIPEKVFEITSATISRSKMYETQVGRFSYIRLPLPYYVFGQTSVELAPRQVALIATPEKALCDKIVATAGLLFRSTLQVKAWLIEDMRVEKESLFKIKIENIRSWLLDSPKKESLEYLIKTLEDL